MLYTTFRVIFWLFVLVEVLLLIFNDRVDRYIKLKTLNWAFALKCVFVAAYIVYTNVAISLPSPMILNIIGYVMLYFLLFLVRGVYLSKIIQSDKTYRMTDLQKVNVHKYAVAGKIEESRYEFDVLLDLSKDEFLKLDAQGYFDPKASHKSLKVKCVRRSIEKDNNVYDALMCLV